MPTLCCPDCFHYDTVIDYIKNHSTGSGRCDYCKANSRYCIDPAKLADLFRPLVDLYTPIVNFMPLEMMKEFEGQNVAEKLLEDWQPFTKDTSDNAENLVEGIFGAFDFHHGGGIDLDQWVENTGDLWGWDDEPTDVMDALWKEFCEELIYKNRFFPRHINLNFLDEIPILKRVFTPGEFLFRSRKKDKKLKIPPRKMGTPPPHLSQPGRANPKGIPYLYLASDIQTAIHEIRPKTSDFITIGKFKVLEKLQILDLSNPSLVDPCACGKHLRQTIQLLSFLNMLGHELSKPIDPKEKELHYIPTQYLCEFIKKKGFDGVGYKSNVGPGLNFALFETSKVKCTRSTLYSIDATPIKI